MIVARCVSKDRVPAQNGLSMKLPRLIRLAVVILASSLVNSALADDAARHDSAHAWLLELPGISAYTGLDREMLLGLRDGGYDGAIQVYDWPVRNPGIPALLATKRNHEEAKTIAKIIEEHRRVEPHGQIVIASHSAGAGLCVWALEALSKDIAVDRVLMLSPALSPDYDLSAALSHVTTGLYAFTSPNDVFVLGAGTRLLGTVDGRKVTSAGLLGFTQAVWRVRQRIPEARFLSVPTRLVEV